MNEIHENQQPDCASICYLLKFKIQQLTWGQHSLSFNITRCPCLGQLQHSVCSDTSKEPKLFQQHNAVISVQTLRSYSHSFLLRKPKKKETKQILVFLTFSDTRGLKYLEHFYRCLQTSRCILCKLQSTIVTC